MMKRLLFLIICVSSFMVAFDSDVYAQGFGVVDEATAGNFFVVGARALGMGGAHIAVANDATALIYNPAGLARVTRIEFSGGLTHQRLNNKTKLGDYPQQSLDFSDGRLQNNTRFSSANVVLPIPTYRGSLVLALGVNRVKSFDKSIQFYSDDGINIQTAIESETGGIYLWSLGAAVDISPNVSVGAALNLWSGKDNYTWFYQRDPISSLDPTVTYDDVINDDYSGFNVKFGVRIQPNRYLVIGGTIESPVTLTIKEDWTQTTEGTGWSEYYSGSSEYKFSLPFGFGAGLALQFGNLTLAGDINYTDWTQMEYKKLEDMGEANRLIKETYRDSIARFNLGAEFVIPKINTSLRAGFYQNPLPYKSRWIKKDRSFFTAGIGFLIDQVMILDIAWAHGSWELQDFITPGLEEKYTTNQIFLSVAYRL